LKNLKNMNPMDLAIYIAVFFGIITAALIVMVEIPQNDLYSSVYIIPGSFTNYPSGNQISFQYGMRSLVDTKTTYIVEFYANSDLIDSKQVELNPSESLEGKKVIDLPQNIQYPVKIRVVARTPERTNEVYYWVNKNAAF